VSCEMRCVKWCPGGFEIAIVGAFGSLGVACRVMWSGELMT
jgi:hypothetical protein